MQSQKENFKRKRKTGSEKPFYNVLLSHYQQIHF